MKKALLTLLVGVMMSSATLGLSFAEDVLVTKSGKKYHHIDATYLKGKDVERITKEEAEARGLEPSKNYLKRSQAQVSESSTQEQAKK